MAVVVVHHRMTLRMQPMITTRHAMRNMCVSFFCVVITQLLLLLFFGL